MIAYIGFAVVVLGLLLSLIDVISGLIVPLVMITGVILAVLPLFVTPEFEERKLVESYTVLPIVSGVYAIKTCDEKVIFKYLDFEEEDKMIIDTLDSWNDIEEIEDNTTPMLNVYEQKTRKSLLTLPVTRYIDVLRIPKNSIITK